MAGVFPVPVKSSGRKQWTLYDGPRRFGRSQLAEDGCPESQVVLAKQLLDEKTDLEIDKEENERMGVYWLMKASEQGHEEATTILQHCLERGKGITEHNFLDVKACLAMSHDEKIARQAAKQLFASMASGDDFITSNQLDDCMRRATIGNAVVSNSTGEGASSSSTPCDWKSRRNSGVEKLTEEMLVSAASRYSKGELPLVHRAVLEVDTNHYVKRHRGYYLLFPVMMLTSCCDHIIDTISRQNLRYFVPIVFANLRTAMFLWIMTRFDFDTIVATLPGVIYFASLITMIIATCQALSKNNDFYNFRRWSNLFLQYSGGNLNAAEAEYQHCCNNLRPYGTFFVALLIHLIFTPIMLQTSSPLSEITIVAFICTFITLYRFTVTSSFYSPPPPVDASKNSSFVRSSSVDLLALFSFAVNVLARYPYETDAVVSCGWRFLDVRVPTFASYVVGNGVEFCLNFRALFYLVIPAVSIKMASRDNWKGTCTSLVPHCMSLAWWQITVLSSQGATWYGLIRSALALVGFVLFLPLAGLATVLIPVVAAGKFLLEFEELSPHLISTLAYCSVPVLVALFIGCFRKNNASKWNVFVSILQVLLVTSSACLFILWIPQLGASTSSHGSVYGRKPMQGISISSDERANTDSLTWPQFQQLCTSPVECSELYGLPVRWDGRVMATRLTRIYNPVAELLHRLPRGIQSAVKCWCGEKYTGKNDGIINSGEIVPSQLLGECHLSNWNRYEFEIDVIMTSGLWRSTESLVTLVGLDNSFKNMTSSLKAGDHVWYSGSLIGDVSGLINQDAARVETEVLGCLICKEDTMNNVIAKKEKIFSLLSIYSGIKAILNFIFNPLVIFR